MSETIEAPVIRFRRVERVDIDEMAGWLIPRAQKSFPTASPAMIRSFVWQAAMNSDQWCGRTDNACALAYVESGILGSPAMVRVAFDFCKNGVEDSLEGGELYYQIGAWAKRMGAIGVEVAIHTDTARLDIRNAMSRLYPLPPHQVYVKLHKFERFIWLNQKGWD